MPDHDVLAPYTVITVPAPAGSGGCIAGDVIYVADQGSIEATRAAARELLSSLGIRAPADV